MKLAFSTNAFKKYPLEESIRAIANIGYEGVEILGGCSTRISAYIWKRTDSINKRCYFGTQDTNFQPQCIYTLCHYERLSSILDRE